MEKDTLQEWIDKLKVKQGDYDVLSERLMFSHIYYLLLSRCQKGTESVRLDYLLNWSIPRRDFFIPAGIRKLRIPANSYIEIKNLLISDTLYRELNVANEYKKTHPNSLCVLVYHGSVVSDDLLKKIKKEKALKVLQYADFVKWISNESAIESQIEVSNREWKEERKLIIDNAKQSFHKNKVSLFLGAGVTQSAGGPSWDELLRKIYNHTHKDIKVKEGDMKKMLESCGNSNIVMGRYVMSETFKKKELSNYLRRFVLYNNLCDSELINSICLAAKTQQLESIITYNYDDIVETAIEKSGIRVARVYNKSRNYRHELPVYHVHGLVTQKEMFIESTPILSEIDYHNMYRENFNWSNVEQLHALDRNVCFFIGLSMTDPNLRRLLDFSHKESDGDNVHYVFMQRKPLYSSLQKHVLNEKHFRKVEGQMQSFGISVIWFESFDEIPRLFVDIISPLNSLSEH